MPRACTSAAPRMPHVRTCAAHLPCVCAPHVHIGCPAYALHVHIGCPAYAPRVHIGCPGYAPRVCTSAAP
eukprot:7291921-Pyramimonas_sp.AAC.1